MTKPTEDEILKALTEQHEVIDYLFARLAMTDINFFPSQSGTPWEKMERAHAIIKRLETHK